MSNQFHTYKKLGVRPSDVSNLLAVSRVTASLWFNDHAEPHRLIEKRVDRLHAAVASAAKLGHLPISNDVPRESRYAKLKQTIEEHLELLGLASIED